MNVSAHELGLGGLDSLAEVDALCLFVAEDDRPLPGTAGYVDWRLCGALSRVLQSGFFLGALNDSLLMPTDGRFPVPRVFVLGLGARRTLGPDALQEALASAGRVLTRARVESVALELPGQGSVDDSVRLAALQERFLPAFRGKKVSVLADKELAKELSRRSPGRKA